MYHLPNAPCPEYSIGDTWSSWDSVMQWGTVMVTGAPSCSPSGSHWIPNATNISSRLIVMYFETSVMTEILMSCVCPRGISFDGTTVLIPRDSNCMSAPASVIDITLDIIPHWREIKLYYICFARIPSIVIYQYFCDFRFSTQCRI